MKTLMYLFPGLLMSLNSSFADLVSHENQYVVKQNLFIGMESRGRSCEELALKVKKSLSKNMTCTSKDSTVPVNIEGISSTRARPSQYDPRPQDSFIVNFTTEENDPFHVQLYDIEYNNHRSSCDIQNDKIVIMNTYYKQSPNVSFGENSSLGTRYIYIELLGGGQVRFVGDLLRFHGYGGHEITREGTLDFLCE